MPRAASWATAAAAILSTGAMFGFFYAWSVSAMWGLDATAPAAAVEAMQAINRAVRNAWFAPAFFGAPLALAAAAALAWLRGARVAAACFGSAALVYGVGCLGVTALVNVPMNRALDSAAPRDAAEAAAVWAAYSPRWQHWNHGRTLASGLALLLAAAGVATLGDRGAASTQSRRSL